MPKLSLSDSSSLTHPFLFFLNLQSGTTKSPRYYPAEDIKPVKPSYKVKQNVSVVNDLLATLFPMPFVDLLIFCVFHSLC